MSPKISIVTITYNSEKTLEETIISVVSQSYDNFEYIIIDGGSSDGTLSIINKYRNDISCFISEPDDGISDAFNKGIERASGDIIGIINSDDLLLPNALKHISNYYNPDIDVYRGRLIVNNPSTGYCYSAGKPTLKCEARHYMSLKVCHPSTFITKRAYEQVGGYRKDIKYIMDIDMLFRLSNAGCPFVYVPEDIALFNLGGATSDAFYYKFGERYRVIVDNDGGVLYAVWVAVLCFSKDIVKLVVDRVMGEDFKNVLFNRKKLQKQG